MRREDGINAVAPEAPKETENGKKEGDNALDDNGEK